MHAPACEIISEPPIGEEVLAALWATPTRFPEVGGHPKHHPHGKNNRTEVFAVVQPSGGLTDDVCGYSERQPAQKNDPKQLRAPSVVLPPSLKAVGIRIVWDGFGRFFHNENQFKKLRSLSKDDPSHFRSPQFRHLRVKPLLKVALQKKVLSALGAPPRPMTEHGHDK